MCCAEWTNPHAGVDLHVGQCHPLRLVDGERPPQHQRELGPDVGSETHSLEFEFFGKTDGLCIV